MKRCLLSLSLLLTFVLISARAAESTNAQSFYFAQFTDTHLGEVANLERTVKIVEAINRLPMTLEFVVHTGDLFYDTITQEETVRAGMAALRKLKPPLYIVPGNHDLMRTNLAATAAIFQTQVGPLYGTADCRGVRLVFWYSESLREGTRLEGYDPFAWLEEALVGAGQRPVLLFHHAPFTPTAYPAPVTKRWGELVRRYPVKAAITGHVHADGLDWTGEVPSFIAGPVADLFQRQASFRVYRYANGHLSYSSLFPD